MEQSTVTIKSNHYLFCVTLVSKQGNNLQNAPVGAGAVVLGITEETVRAVAVTIKGNHYFFGVTLLNTVSKQGIIKLQNAPVGVIAVVLGITEETSSNNQTKLELTRDQCKLFNL